MQARTLKQAIEMIKVHSAYMNDDHMITIKIFVSALFNIEYSKLVLMLNETE